jgi:transcriptional regulator GlxA family with amidase domain
MFLTDSSLKLSYRLFLSGLEYLLKDYGIASNSQFAMAADNNKKNHDDTSHRASQQVGNVIIFIEEHLTEELSLERLAEEARLSKYQLIRRFQIEQGITPWKFLVSKRIEKAKELLANGLSPGQTAMETGFFDQSHLNKVFKEKTGLTPKEYQEKYFINRN